MRRVERGRLGAEERVGAHRRRQIWPGELAGPADLRRRIASARDDFFERVEKGVEEGDIGVYIAGLDLGNGIRFRALDAIERRRGIGLGRVSYPRKKRRGPGSSARQGEKNVLLWGFAWLGRGPNSELGRFGSPSASFIFLIFFIFFFLFLISICFI
jgi:hypothetical protein